MPIGICTCAAVGVLMAVGTGKVTHAAPDPWKPYPILESCTRDDAQYATMFFKTEDFVDWPAKYHTRVNEIIEEYLKPPEIIACLNPVLIPLAASSKLYALASELPPWQDPTDLAQLDRNDYGIVLLEYLRIYECALFDHNFGPYLVMEIIQERYEDEAGGGPLPLIIDDFLFEDLKKEIRFRRRLIEQEIATARPALERALIVISSLTRLSPLDAELECLQRASLDLRNGLGLAADASVCMPKGWDVKDPLRDL
jgi:hypothetical protein